MNTRIKKLIHKKNGRYEVVLEDKSLELDEDIILKYRLFEGYELKDEARLILEDMEKKYLNMALKYQLRYGKTSFEVEAYLLKKELSKDMVYHIMCELKEKHLIDDEVIARSIASTLARNSNGSRVIRLKLKDRGLKDEVIERVIEELLEEDYILGVRKLYKKGMKQYANSPYLKHKLRELFYRRGYIELPDFDNLEL